MRILITGREGQLARSLAERGVGRDLVFAGRPDCDLLDPASIVAAVERARPDIVVSAAAYTMVDKAEDDAETAMAVNGVAPGVLAQAAVRVGARVIHVSTDYVFDGSSNRPYREDDPVAPLGVYGRTKLAGERAVMASGATWTILRTAWVFGPFGANFVKTMLRVAAAQDDVRVVSDQHGCPTSSLDLADAVLALADLAATRPEAGKNAVLHAAGTGCTSWAGFAEAIFAGSAARRGPHARVHAIATSDYPTRATRPANSALDTSRLAALLGHPMLDWRVSLGVTLDRLI